MLKKALAIVTGASLVALSTAQAQFAAPSANNPGALLGDSTAGTESGIYEFLPMVVAAAGIGVLIVLAYRGWRMATKAINRTG